MKKERLLLVAMLLVQTSFSQTDSAFLQTAFPERTATNAGEPLYNGRHHVTYSTDIEGIPYYRTDAWQTGTVVYQNTLYRDVALKYDLVTDELVVRHLNKVSGIVLFTPRVSLFTVGTNVFTKLPVQDPGMRGGLYEELYKGKISLYAKRSKLLEEKVVGTKLERKISDQDAYYAFKDGRYVGVKNEKSMLALTGGKREEIKAWLKASGIKFKNDPGAALVRIAERYNELTR